MAALNVKGVTKRWRMADCTGGGPAAATETSFGGNSATSMHKSNVRLRGCGNYGPVAAGEPIRRRKKAYRTRAFTIHIMRVGAIICAVKESASRTSPALQ